MLTPRYLTAAPGSKPVKEASKYRMYLEDRLKILEELKRVRLPGHVSVALARVYAALGEKDEAFSNLDKGFQEGNPYMIWIKVHPTFESLRSDARFQDLLRWMNFSK
jgi:hypothetical protein